MVQLAPCLAVRTILILHPPMGEMVAMRHESEECLYESEYECQCSSSTVGLMAAYSYYACLQYVVTHRIDPCRRHH